MDFSGLILLIGLLIIGGILYLASRNTGIVARKPDPAERSDRYEGQEPYRTSTQDLYKTDDLLETSEDIFPLIEFPPDPAEEGIPELPETYGESKISLMARDPLTLYAYWEVSEDKQKELGSRWLESVPVIRIYDVTGINYFDGNNASYRDEMVNDYANSWYISIERPGRVYCADLGRKFSNGSFLMIARSNFTYTPRNALSNRVDPEWMLVSDNQKKLYARIGHGDGNSSFDLSNR